MNGDSSAMNRRAFLRLGGLGLVVSAVDPTVARAAGAAAERLATTGGSGQILVYVFMRFGADGLNIVVPTEDGEYTTYKGYRPTLAVDRNHPKIGRLDADSEGLILLTNDGDFAQEMAHPKYGVPKTYAVLVRGHVDPEGVSKVRGGVWLAEGRTSGAVVRVCASAFASFSNCRTRNQPCFSASSTAFASMPLPLRAAGVRTTFAPRKRIILRRSMLKLSAIVTTRG